jgi:hypothetical protein
VSSIPVNPSRRAQFNLPAVVHREHQYGRPPDRGQPFDTRSPPGKVLGPPVTPRVKQRHDPAALPVKAG